MFERYLIRIIKALCQKSVVGAFGFPSGVVFSQPAILDKHKMWTPFKSFPLTNKTRDEIEKLISPAQELLDELGVCGTTIRANYSSI